MLVANNNVAGARRWLGASLPGNTPVIILSRRLRAAAIRSLLQLGARDFVASDCDQEELQLRLWRLCRTPRSRPGSDCARSCCHPLLLRLIGSDPTFLTQIERIPVIAGCDAGVLILGETGTGKELCARAIHELSGRAARPWVAVNCGALPADLVESELFGHARGAYTSANEARVGLIGEAEGGTVFLDEIDSLPQAAQAKLLRFLQEKEYRLVGDARPRRANVRVVAATNSDPSALVEAGRLRRDLYHRLNVLSLHLPPLRERREDLMPLIDHFVCRFATESGCPVRGLTRAALARLAEYRWPGNVRELEHAIQRAVLFCRGEFIDAVDLELPAVEAPRCQNFRAAKDHAVKAFERSYIERLLLMCDGNITHAAEAAGKDRRAFWQLIRKHGIDAERYRVPERHDG
uniref:AAA domain-containing protein n=2 Tax=Aromatoleum buckelii TaxID=200254 RepID=A0ABX1N4Z0_9RHOO